MAHYTCCFISDTHLGTNISQAEALSFFLKSNTFDKLYLVGDIIDMVALKKKFLWSGKHNKVISQLVKLKKKGVNVIYIPGNHDYYMRDFIGEEFGGIPIIMDDVHITSSGKRYLVLHGDEFDGFIKDLFWLYHLGDWAYSIAIVLNAGLNKLRQFLKLKKWSLSLYLKNKVKNVISFINDFEKLVVDEAKRRNIEGVICGHIHKAEMKQIENIHYCNTGCWTEFCSAIIENEQGDLELIYIEHE